MSDRNRTGSESATTAGDWKTGSLPGVLVTVLLWAAVWGVIPGGLIEALDNITSSAHGFTRQVDMWMQTLALPGVLGGLVYAIVLRLSAPGRRLAGLSAAAAGGWGAVAGLIAGVIVTWGVYPGLSGTWGSAAVALSYAVVMGAVAGVLTPGAFRWIAHRRAAATA